MADAGGWFPALPDELWRGATAARSGRTGGASLLAPTADPAITNLYQTPPKSILWR